MQLTATLQTAQDQKVDLVAAILFEEDLANPEVPWFGVPYEDLQPLLAQAVAEERFKAKLGQTLVAAPGDRLPARRIALVGAGPRSDFNPADFRHPAATLAGVANRVGARSLLVLANPADNPKLALARAEGIAQGLLLGVYRFDKYLASEKRTPVTLEASFIQMLRDDAHSAVQAALDRAGRVARAVCHARDLVNEPAGRLTPSDLAANTTARAREAGLAATVLGPDDCRALGMGLFLAVAQGSDEEPRFVHLAWKPSNAKRRVVLVGKGVTFDSGGLSLKTTEGMLDMKSDMAGAAAVLAAIVVAAEENLPVEVHALAACTENMPSGSAYKLGDVLRSMSGRTVEINNTDAEGRLTLADALTFGLDLNPDAILDFATLTGACVVALGPNTAGVMSNNDAIRDSWLMAARRAGEDMWPLPLPTRLAEQLKSEIADLRNTGERWGGALTAGLFLREFVGKKPWIHVDLAGPATTTKEWGCFPKGATGFGVASIVEYLRQLANEPPSPTESTKEPARDDPRDHQ